MEKPKIEYNEDSETYKIQIGKLKIFLEYGADKTFDWFYCEENTIHKGNIKITNDESMIINFTD